MEQILEQGKVVAPVDVLVRMGLLGAERLEEAHARHFVWPGKGPSPPLGLRSIGRLRESSATAIPYHAEYCSGARPTASTTLGSRSRSALSFTSTTRTEKRWSSPKSNR